MWSYITVRDHFEINIFWSLDVQQISSWGARFYHTNTNGNSLLRLWVFSDSEWLWIYSGSEEGGLSQVYTIGVVNDLHIGSQTVQTTGLVGRWVNQYSIHSVGSNPDVSLASCTWCCQNYRPLLNRVSIVEEFFPQLRCKELSHVNVGISRIISMIRLMR